MRAIHLFGLRLLVVIPLILLGQTLNLVRAEAPALSKVWEEGEWKVYQDLNPILIEKKTWTYHDDPARYDIRATNESSRALCLLINVEPLQNGRIDQMTDQSLVLPNHRTDLGWVGAQVPGRDWDVKLRFKLTSELSRCFNEGQ